MPQSYKKTTTCTPPSVNRAHPPRIHRFNFSNNTPAGLTLVEPEIIGVPGIKELPLTLERKVVYRQEQESHLFNEDITREFYTIEKGDHICYYGEIVAAYIIED